MYRLGENTRIIVVVMHNLKRILFNAKSLRSKPSYQCKSLCSNEVINATPQLSSNVITVHFILKAFQDKGISMQTYQCKVFMVTMQYLPMDQCTTLYL